MRDWQCGARQQSTALSMRECRGQRSAGRYGVALRVASVASVRVHNRWCDAWRDVAVPAYLAVGPLALGRWVGQPGHCLSRQTAISAASRLQAALAAQPRQADHVNKTVIY